MALKLILSMIQYNTYQLTYYTEDHEWIVFDKEEAYVGVGLFKLTGIGFIEKIVYMEWEGVCKRGELIAIILSGDYEILVHMPVDGRLIENNKRLLEEPSLIYNQSEEPGWIAKINPLIPDNIDSLMPSEEYITRTYRKMPHV